MTGCSSPCGTIAIHSYPEIEFCNDSAFMSIALSVINYPSTKSWATRLCKLRTRQSNTLTRRSPGNSQQECSDRSVNHYFREKMFVFLENRQKRFSKQAPFILAAIHHTAPLSVANKFCNVANSIVTFQLGMVLQFSYGIGGGLSGLLPPAQTHGENIWENWAHGGAKWLASPCGSDSPWSWRFQHSKTQKPSAKSPWNHQLTFPEMALGRSPSRVRTRRRAKKAWARDAGEVQSQLLHGFIGQQVHCLRLGAKSLLSHPRKDQGTPKKWWDSVASGCVFFCLGVDLKKIWGRIVSHESWGFKGGLITTTTMKGKSEAASEGWWNPHERTIWKIELLGTTVQIRFQQLAYSNLIVVKNSPTPSSSKKIQRLLFTGRPELLLRPRLCPRLRRGRNRRHRRHSCGRPGRSGWQLGVRLQEAQPQAMQQATALDPNSRIDKHDGSKIQLDPKQLDQKQAWSSIILQVNKKIRIHPQLQGTLKASATAKPPGSPVPSSLSHPSHQGL